MRAFLLVIDSFGIGALPDAEQYGDRRQQYRRPHRHAPSAESKWPLLTRMGLGNAARAAGRGSSRRSRRRPLLQASFGVMREVSPGKDTTTGHWELSGIQLENAVSRRFLKNTRRFRKQLLDRLTAATGYEFLGNKAASGTAVIEELGAEHLATGKPIAYTSGDSVFQIAAHEDVVPLDKLYALCAKRRANCLRRLDGGRVIARPFRGRPGAFETDRGPARLQLSSAGAHHSRPSAETNGVETVAVGKIGDIFNGQGIDVSHADKGNPAVP